jgi:hypothetical protein
MIKVTHYDHGHGKFYKAVSKIVYDSDVQDYREVFYGTIDNKNFNVEVYQGPNYVVESNSRRNWSRQYKGHQFPSKLLGLVEELKAFYHKHFQV